MNNTTNEARQTIAKIVAAYAEMRGTTVAEVLAAFETSESVRNSIFALAAFVAAKK